MIDIKKKEDCVGCNACVQRCPKSCISMIEDEQGFLYPKVDLNKCIDCHLCEKACPVINQEESRKPLHTYAAKNNNAEVQETSSSGGVFFALVEYVIKEKQGVVFGARFNDKWEVVHDYAETIKDAEAFKGSKYVQSRIDDNFKKAEDFLKSGRTVLFSGTPCQIAGLRLFLRKDYENQLICVDIICHGVPSPMVWRDYLKYLSSLYDADFGNIPDFQTAKNLKSNSITGITFRDKHISWENYGFSVQSVCQTNQNSDLVQIRNCNEENELLYESHNSNIYMQGFLKDLYLRPSCYACPAKCGKSNADITLGDFWGIKNVLKDFYMRNGVSLVCINTTKGESLFFSAIKEYSTVNFDDCLKYNPALIISSSIPKQYHKFWDLYPQKGIGCIKSIVRKSKPGLIRKIWRKFQTIFNF